MLLKNLYIFITLISVPSVENRILNAVLPKLNLIMVQSHPNTMGAYRQLLLVALACPLPG